MATTNETGAGWGLGLGRLPRRPPLMAALLDERDQARWAELCQRGDDFERSWETAFAAIDPDDIDAREELEEECEEAEEALYDELGPLLEDLEETLAAAWTEQPQVTELLAALKTLTDEELDPDTLTDTLAARLDRSPHQVEYDLFILSWMYTIGPDGLAQAQCNAREEAIVHEFGFPPREGRPHASHKLRKR